MLTLKIRVVTYCAFVTFSVALLKSGQVWLPSAGASREVIVNQRQAAAVLYHVPPPWRIAGAQL